LIQDTHLRKDKDGAVSFSETVPLLNIRN